MSNSGYCIYIFRCCDESLCVGSTHNLDARVRAHRAGQAATYTAARLPVRLVYSEPHATQADAVTRERQIKRWSRQKKLALIHGDIPTLKALSKRRS